MQHLCLTTECKSAGISSCSSFCLLFPSAGGASALQFLNAAAMPHFFQSDRSSVSSMATSFDLINRVSSQEGRFAS